HQTETARPSPVVSPRCFRATATGSIEEERRGAAAGPMEKKQESSHQYGSLERTEWSKDTKKPDEDVVSMADSTITVDDIEGELFKIDRIRDVLVRRESELRYMMDDIQLCKEITRLKKDLQKLVSIPDNDKSNEDRQKEEELLQQSTSWLRPETSWWTIRVPSRAQQTSSPFAKTGLTLLKECCGFTCSIM
ncbi:hypothetical protein F7725_005637, partial [Dissostichus mawsoni]